MAGKQTTRSVPVTETEVDPPAKDVDAPGTDGADHVTETEGGGVEIGGIGVAVVAVAAVVGGAGHVIVTGIVGTENGLTVRDLVRRSARLSLWRTKRGKGRRRGREKEGNIKVEGERSQCGGTWHHEALSIFHHCSTRLCKVGIVYSTRIMHMYNMLIE